MGATGAGKTSVVQLLQRLYDATDGVIRLDGVDIRDLTFDQLRGSISLVMQDVFLFSDTITENVKLGKRDIVDLEAVRKAALAAQASSFIEKMDNTYDTVIGERGVGLSVVRNSAQPRQSPLPKIHRYSSWMILLLPWIWKQNMKSRRHYMV